LHSLAAIPTVTGPDVEDTDPELVPIDAAVQAVLGSGYSTRDQVARPRPAPPAPPPPPVGSARPATALTSRELASLLASRVGPRLRRTLRRISDAPRARREGATPPRSS
jgi:hypothetical protein